MLAYYKRNVVSECDCETLTPVESDEDFLCSLVMASRSSDQRTPLAYFYIFATVLVRKQIEFVFDILRSLRQLDDYL